MKDATAARILNAGNETSAPFPYLFAHVYSRRRISMNARKLSTV